MAVGALPAREAVTVIATNQVFARKSIKARLPFTLIGVCERDTGGDGPAAPAAHAAAATSAAHSHAHAPRPAGPLTQLAGGPHPLLRTHALKAVHLVHTRAPRRTRVGGTLVDVCGESRGRSGGDRGGEEGAASPQEGVCAPGSSPPSGMGRLAPAPLSPGMQAGAPRCPGAGSHPAHRWARSSPTGSGTRSPREPRGRSPRWHTGWKRRRARLRGEPQGWVWRPGPHLLQGLPHPSPRRTQARGVGPATAAPTYPAHSSCPSSRQGRRSGTGRAPR